MMIHDQDTGGNLCQMQYGKSKGMKFRAQNIWKNTEETFAMVTGVGILPLVSMGQGFYSGFYRQEIKIIIIITELIHGKGNLAFS